MAVRVLRLMEYTYDDLERAHEDMARWQVQGTFRPRPDVTIRSTVLLDPQPFDEPLPLDAEPGCKYDQCVEDASVTHYHQVPQDGGPIETVYL